MHSLTEPLCLCRQHKLDSSLQLFLILFPTFPIIIPYPIIRYFYQCSKKVQNILKTFESVFLKWDGDSAQSCRLLNCTRIILSPTFHSCSNCFELVSENAWQASNICTLNSNQRSVRLAVLRGPVHHGAGTVNLFRWRAFRADCRPCIAAITREHSSAGWQGCISYQQRKPIVQPWESTESN